MGKISPPSIKYVIKAKFIAEGVVEKPDVIGAIFGQTEGLLGEDLELRELQKKGKIGRIEAEMRIEDSKTYGTVEIPTSIDKTETTMIAAAVETIDRVGPCDAKFEIGDVEDVRTSKRQFIIDRAKALLEKLASKTPESREIENEIINNSKTAKIIEYGEEKLPAGPDVDTSQEVIVVEGRADVLVLLKAGLKNVIAMNGTVLPDAIKELSKTKNMIMFVDGDRGGLLMVKDAIEHSRVKSITRAPDGKEVEELTEKEILGCLRNAVSVDDFVSTYFRKETRRRQIEEPIEQQQESFNVNMEDLVKEVIGTKKFAVVLDTSRGPKLIKKPISELTKVLLSCAKARKKVPVLVIDGTLTANDLHLAERVGCREIAAKTFAATSEKIKFLSF